MGKLSNSQLNKLKSAIKNGTAVTLNLSTNIIGDSNDENNFLHKLLLTNTQVSRIRKTFLNGSSAYIKLSKTHLHKIGQSGGFLGLLLKTGLSLIGSILEASAKSVLIRLGLMGAASATAAAIQKTIYGSGTTALIISDEEMKDIMKIVKYLEDSGLLIKSVIEKNKNQPKEQKGRSLSMLLETLGASLLGDLLTGKGRIRAGKGTIRAGENF